MKYLTAEQYAKKHNISTRLVRRYCSACRIKGCITDGKTWLIPEDADKPDRKIRTVLKVSLLTALKREKDAKLKGGIYHRLQIEYTYNSNHIEGSKLSHDQTAMIFETKTIGALSTTIKVDDIIETMNHFKCIDYVIEHATNKLSEKFIKQLHYILKQNTSDSFLDWFNVGDYKLLENQVGNQSTTSVKNVKKEMISLLNEYNSLTEVTIEDIISFHYRFERIHPFQDGNGRIGRLIILKECLKNNLVPILIKDEFKEFYYRGLVEYKKEKGYLIDTCLHGQDIVKEYLDYFKIKY